jgi:hypothetical protein
MKEEKYAKPECSVISRMYSLTRVSSPNFTQIDAHTQRNTATC